MSYFDNVYLGGINRYGNTLQQRIINKKENDFNYFVEKSPDKVIVYIQDDKIVGVMQTKEYDEIETIDYFLTFKSLKIPTGTILKVLNIKNPKEYTYWIVVAKDNFISAGYNRYTVVKLDREIRWITEDGYVYKALAHISGAGANARDNRVTSKYKINNDALVFQTHQNLTMTIKDCPGYVKRGYRITIKDTVWRISGIENISVDGVCYLTLEEDYYNKTTDDSVHLDGEDELYNTKDEGIADSEKLTHWTFNCPQWDGSSKITIYIDSDGNEYEEEPIGIEVTTKEYPLIDIIDSMAIDFSASYYGAEQSNALDITSSSAGLVYEDRQVTIYDVTEKPYLSVKLTDSPEIGQRFYFNKVTEKATFIVDGPSRAKLGDEVVFSSEYKFTIDKSDNYSIVKVEKKEGEPYKLILIFNEIEENLDLKFIGQDSSFTEETSYVRKITIDSPWLGGI